MALWEIITFSVLIGALLVYAGLITRRLSRAEGRLNTIEETLLAKSQSAEPDGTPAPEPKLQVPDGQDGRGIYLTLRDLRARSEQRAVKGQDALSLPTMHTVSRDSTDLPTMRAGSGAPEATPPESHEAPRTHGEEQGPPDHPPPEDDSIARKNRNTVLFLSTQRRRR